MRLIKLVLSVSLITGASALFAQQTPRDPRYPAHWWTPVIDPQKPDWEIPPQEAAPGEVILSKRHELGLIGLALIIAKLDSAGRLGLNSLSLILFTPGFSQVMGCSARKRKPFKRFAPEIYAPRHLPEGVCRVINI